MNKNSAEMWAAATAAAAVLTKQKIDFCLMGTMAILAHGHDTGDFEAHDVDFYVTKVPKGYESANYADSSNVFGDVDVQFIPVKGTKWGPFFTALPEFIGGIPVGDLKDVLGAKRSANRLKDRLFFEAHSDLAAIVD